MAPAAADAHIQAWAALLVETEHDPSEAVQIVRRAAVSILNALQAMCSPPAVAAPPTAAPRFEVFKRPRPGGGSRSTLDVDEIVRRYQDGQTPPQIGKALGHMPGTIRRALDRAGVPRRDDRTTHSGSDPKDYDPALVDRIRRLYTRGLTQRQVAEQIGTTQKVVQSVMGRHGIQARPAAHLPRNPHAAAQRSGGQAANERANSYVASDVREWCREVGMRCPAKGRFLPATVVAAYQAAHPTGASA